MDESKQGTKYTLKLTHQNNKFRTQNNIKFVGVIVC